MRRKLYSCISSLILITLLITGCNNNQSNKGEKNTPNTESKSIEYSYKQNLNVIDDNYRNYYEIFLYSFCDSNNDGIGDINGLISKLDYLNDGDDSTDTDLGINGIWLMPIMPSPSYHKYDVINYYEIDPQYGTIEDFNNLIKECDKRGIKVIIDLVLNHTSSENEWFQSAIKSLAIEPCGLDTCKYKELCREHNKYVGYYNFVKDKPADGDFYLAGDSEWYYQGVFVNTMPDLNLANKELRKDIESIVDYWLNLGVHGFRLDAAKEFYSGSPEKNIEVLKWLNDYVKSKKTDAYIVAEVWDSFTAFTKYYQSGIDSIFNFSFAKEDGKIATTLLYSDASSSGKAFADAMVLVQDTIKKNNPNGIDAPFMTNHDTGRMAGILGYDDDKIKIAGAMNLFMSGSSFIYYGEEIGMSGSGRDENKRAPMNWSSTNVTGMTTGPSNMEEVTHKFPSVEEQLGDSGSILNYYKRALRLKNENPEIARGTVQTISDITDADMCAVSKEYNGNKIYMIYNLSEEEKVVTLNKGNYGYEGIRGYLTLNGEEVSLDGDSITLPKYSIVILK